MNSRATWKVIAADAEQTAKALNLEVQALRLENPPYDFDAAFANAAAGGAQMVLVLSGPFFAASGARYRIGKQAPLAFDVQCQTLGPDGRAHVLWG
jgi:hypothetical protein